MTARSLIDITLTPIAGARAPFAMHAADGTLIGFCEAICAAADGQLLITGWTTRAEVGVCSDGAARPASLGATRPGVAPAGAARDFRALLPACDSGFLTLRGSDGEDAFLWRRGGA